MKSDLLSRIALAALLCFGLVLTGCYDDSALRSQLNDYGEQLDDHELRLRELERLCSQFNTNISALQTAVSALEQNVYVTSVNPVKNGSDVIGYVIVFSNSETATIYHGSDGKDGADGHTPVIGVKMDTDSVYYWTLDGKWLLDDLDAKLPVTGPEGSDGKDGQAGAPGTDGVTPKLKIEDGYWYVSYDGGNTWEEESLGKAVGENGDDGVDGDSFFRNVVVTDDDVTFIFKDGTQVSLPLHGEQELDIRFELDPQQKIVPGRIVLIHYVISGGTGDYVLRGNASGSFSDLRISPSPTSDNSGDILVKCETPDMESQSALSYNSGMYIHLSLSDSSGKHIQKTLNLTLSDGVMLTSLDRYEARLYSNTIGVKCYTNIPDGEFKVVIPSEAQSWLSYEPQTKADLRQENLNFTCEYNEGMNRSAVVSIYDKSDHLLKSFVIWQQGLKPYQEGDYEFMKWLVDNRAYGDAGPVFLPEYGVHEGFTGLVLLPDADGNIYIGEIYFRASDGWPSSSIFNSFPPTVNLQYCESIYINCTYDGTSANTPEAMNEEVKCALKGSEFPSEWNCPNLKRVHLECTGMQGVIPDSFAALPNLVLVFFRHNDFYGALPHEWKSGKLENLSLPYIGRAWDCPNLGYLVPATCDVILNSEKFIWDDLGYGIHNDLNMIHLGGQVVEGKHDWWVSDQWKGFENGWGQKRYVKFGGGAEDDLTTWSDYRGLTSGTDEEIAPGGLRNPNYEDTRWYIDSWNGWYCCVITAIPHEMHEWNQAEADAFTAEMAARPRIFTRE